MIATHVIVSECHQLSCRKEMVSGIVMSYLWVKMLVIYILFNFLLKVWSCCCCVPRMMWKYLLADYLVHYTTCNVNRTAAPAGLSVCLRVVTVLGVGYQGGPPLPTLAHRPDLSGPGQLSRPGHLHHRHGLEWHHPIQHCPAEL